MSCWLGTRWLAFSGLATSGLARLRRDAAIGVPAEDVDDLLVVAQVRVRDIALLQVQQQRGVLGRDVQRDGTAGAVRQGEVDLGHEPVREHGACGAEGQHQRYPRPTRQRAAAHGGNVIGGGQVPAAGVEGKREDGSLGVGFRHPGRAQQSGEVLWQRYRTRGSGVHGEADRSAGPGHRLDSRLRYGDDHRGVDRVRVRPGPPDRVPHWRRRCATPRPGRPGSGRRSGRAGHRAPPGDRPAGPPVPTAAEYGAARTRCPHRYR